MPRSDSNSRELVLNAAPIGVPDERIEVGVEPYEAPAQSGGEGNLAKLRRQHYRTHVFLRRDSSILCVPVTEDAGELGSDAREVALHQDYGLVGALVRDAIIRYLCGLGRPVLHYRPVRFLAEGRGDELLREAASGIDLPDWLAVRVQYALDVRILSPKEAPATPCITLDVSTRHQIECSCAELLDMGFPLRDRYAQVEREHQDGRLKPKRLLAGRVVSVAQNTHLQLADSREGLDEIPAEDAFLEPRFENLRALLDHVVNSDAERLLEAVDRKRSELTQGPQRLKRIRQVQEHLANQPLELVPGLEFSIEPMLKEGAEEAFFPQPSACSKPVYVFGPSRTATWHDGGLQKHGPYDQAVFTPKEPRVAVICQSCCRGRVEQFVRNLMDGLPDVTTRSGRAPFGNGLMGKYRLNDRVIEFFEAESSDADSYISAARKAVEKARKTENRWDIALIQIEDRFHQFEGADNPYLASKAMLMRHRIVSQEVSIETMEKGGTQLAYILNNIALATYAKLGGVPWLLQANPAIAHELVCGLGSAIFREGRLGRAERKVGITTVFSGDGNYIVSKRSTAVPFDEYPDELYDMLTDTLETVSNDLNWQRRDSVRLIFHAFKPFRNIEAKVVKRLTDSLGEYAVEHAFVHVAEHHPYVMFDTCQQGTSGRQSGDGKGRYAPQRGLRLPLTRRKLLLCLRGPKEVRQAGHGLPSPLLLSLHRDSTFWDTAYLAQQVYAFSCHSWRTFFPSPLPVTILYSQLIAQLLGQFRHLPDWTPDTMLGPISRTKWFL